MRGLFHQAEQLFLHLIRRHCAHVLASGCDMQGLGVHAQVLCRQFQQLVLGQFFGAAVLAAQLGSTHGDGADHVALGIHLHGHFHRTGRGSVPDGLLLGLPAHTDDVIVGGVGNAALHHITHHGQCHADGGNDRAVLCQTALVMQFILIIFIHCWWSCSYKTHIAF